MCNGSPSYPSDCPPTAAHALLCYSAGDQVSGFPTTYSFAASTPVYSTVNVKIATSWTNFLGGATLLQTLTNAHVTTAGTPWVGCTNTGTFSPTTPSCTGWTSTAAGVNGERASITTTATTWMATTTATCATSQTLLCMCQGRTGAPSRSPTRSPSRSPSRSPTKSPTVMSSSKVFLYTTAAATYSEPAVHTRALTDTICQTTPTVPPACLAPSAHAMISYSAGDQVSSFPSAYSFNNYVSVYGPTNILIAESWTNLLGGAALQNSLVGAAAASNGDLIWSASLANGNYDSAHNCAGWTSNLLTVNADEVAVSSTATTWFGGAGTLQCDTTTVKVLCMCRPTTATPSRSPSASPTPPTTFRPSRSPTSSKPSASPTTDAPSKSPSRAPTASPTANVILYSDNVNRSPNFGNRAASTAICKGMAAYGTLGCSNAAALLCYSGDNAANLPSSLGFSAGTPVRSSGGTHLANNWASLIAGPLSTALTTAGVTTASNAYTGCSAAGAWVSATTSCNQWTSNTAGYNFAQLAAGLNSAGWFSTGGQPFCNTATTLPLVCVCVL